MKKIDLHTHTRASDGTLSSEELIALAKEKGVAAVAITDHDTVQGVSKGMDAGMRYGVEVVPGVEISTVYQAEMHILGYYMDFQSPPFVEALERLKRLRDERNPKILERLQQLGMDISQEEVEKAAGGAIIGRPHFAKVMAEKGYVASVEEAFSKFLTPGKPAYYPKEKLTPEEGIALIRNAGGIPVLAHPKYLGHSLEQLAALLQNLKGFGLRGLEAFYSTHTMEETTGFIKLANRFNLVITGGSDFHGDTKPDIGLGDGLGNLFVPDYYLKDLQMMVNDSR